MKKQKELDRLTKELVKQMTGNEVEDPQEGDYQIAYYYLSKAMDYTHSCTELKEKKAISFRDWVNQNKYTRFGNGYQRNEIVFSKEEMWQRFENRN